MRGYCTTLLLLLMFIRPQPAVSNAEEPDRPEAPNRARTPYETMGAPTDPRVPIRWNRYHDYQEVSDLLRQLAEVFPETARLRSLGTSYDGREMWLLTITDFSAGEDTAKPAFWIDGGIHANEVQSVEAVLYTAWYLLEMQPRHPHVERLLKQRTFYLMPMLSPDSRDAHFYLPNSTHTPRTGQRPVDDDLDGRIDEDGPDDLDGDGHITQMRIRDPHGRWKSHPEFPDLMIRTEPGEQGQYTLLGTEGYDRDRDGRVNEDGDGYYDPNRDWGWMWQPPHVQRGAHRYPFSIEENRLAADFIREHPNIAGAQSYHNTGGMILRGPGPRSETYAAADVAVYDALAKRGEQILPGYKYKIVGPDLYELWGGQLDWLHQMQGIFAFTNELFTPFNFFRDSSGEGFFAGGETLRRFDRYLLFEQGFVPWKEVEHPDYGTIEVGGLKKNWGRQPPSFLLEEECHRNMAFTLYHADQMPLVKIHSAEVVPLGADLFQVTAVVENQRLIPTHSAADLQNRVTPPNILTITGGDRVVLALRSDDLLFREPQEQQRDPAKLQIPNIPGNGAVHVRWLIQGAGPYQLELHSVKGGSDSRTVE
jgi:hypothetical protein